MLYVIAFLVPALGILSFYAEGWLCFSLPLFGFVVMGLVDLIIGPKNRTIGQLDFEKLSKRKFFRGLLYLQLPLQFFALFSFLNGLSDNVDTITHVGRVLSMGIMCGVLGINVAHELGHSLKPLEQWMAQALLLSSGYMHFFIEHNRGHHKNVGKYNDPATARLGENLFSFVVRSSVDGYRHAWKLENSRLSKEKRPLLTWSNQMIRFSVVQLVFMLSVTILFDWSGLLYYMIVAGFGAFFVEAIDYIEHYGLTRKEIKPGIYEAVQDEHSWNSDHPFSRAILFELPLHPDHHKNSYKPYQTLSSSASSPQMPMGYSSMILMAMIPPIWFRKMNPIIETFEQQKKS